MDVFQAVMLALIQGLTEFLPISSSAHLILPSKLFGWPDQGLAFDVAVHVGTLSAVMLYFRKDIVSMTVGGGRSVVQRRWNPDSRLLLMVVIATIPAGIAGLILNDYVDEYLRFTWIIATTTLIFGLLLWYADTKGARNKKMSEVVLQTALLIGFAQALALIPGTSRSGITITAALLLGFNREAAAHFSFLLSIPLILAGGGLKTLDLLSSAGSVDWQIIIVGVVISSIVAYATIGLFISLLDKVGMLPFVIYRLLLGVLLIGFIWL